MINRQNATEQIILTTFRAFFSKMKTHPTWHAFLLTSFYHVLRGSVSTVLTATG